MGGVSPYIYNKHNNYNDTYTAYESLYI
jgi:hypothetical protein